MLQNEEKSNVDVEQRDDTDTQGRGNGEAPCVFVYCDMICILLCTVLIPIYLCLLILQVPEPTPNRYVVDQEVVLYVLMRPRRQVLVLVKHLVSV